ncbi:MAG: hypothetical protein KAI72_02255 [Candidatus Pacebacteria bacterium]|nr:hypothetical protein [Candidatus Paceibacterota bacterium]
MYYVLIEAKKGSTVIEDVVKPQIKRSVGMFDYWFWKSGRDNNCYILELRYLDDTEGMNNLLNGLKDIELAKEISYEKYRVEVCQIETKLEEPILVVAK